MGETASQNSPREYVSCGQHETIRFRNGMIDIINKVASSASTLTPKAVVPIGERTRAAASNPMERAKEIALVRMSIIIPVNALKHPSERIRRVAPSPTSKNRSVLNAVFSALTAGIAPATRVVEKVNKHKYQTTPDFSARCASLFAT